jgi:hypothetical protein
MEKSVQYFDGWATGIEDQTINITPFELFPVPASSLLNLRFNNRLQGKLLVKICDLTGKMVYKKELKNQKSETHKINVSALKSGTYVVKIRFNNLIFSKKFIKE